MADQTNGILSPFLRKLRIKTALPYIKGSVLDFGCGVGNLAEFVNHEMYIAIDIDEESISIAQSSYPEHKFFATLQLENLSRKFDTVVSLAVIEHVSNAVEFINSLKALLAEDGLIVLTTPHPCGDIIHSIGSKLKLFSQEAHEEHQELINGKRMKEIAVSCGMNIVKSKRFLFGLNQLFVLKAAE
ncbi:MAG: methyltransferase domain-containing protein [Planctomycetes bacterium]|nr:methyltransferase domain-containing protein [Planctomycetota bacterium]